MIVLALTGSIGMGKSTTATMFRDAGVPVYDADAAVHALYKGEAALIIGAQFPGTVTDGKVDRAKLGAIVLADPDALKRLEALVHPLVRAAEQRFLVAARTEGEELVILDIPLLFETGGESRVDGVVVVTCDAAEQRRRVLARPGMTEAKFDAILARQTPDAEKRARADFVIDTGLGMESARAAVSGIVRLVKSGEWRPGRPSR